MICRQEGGVLADHLDGRVLRALLGRGFVQREGDGVLATAAGRAHDQDHIRRRRRTLVQFDPTIGGARAAVLHKHIDGLEGVLPPGVELRVAICLAMSTTSSRRSGAMREAWSGPAWYTQAEGAQTSRRGGLDGSLTGPL
jgi:hypothetical protein